MKASLEIPSKNSRAIKRAIEADIESESHQNSQLKVRDNKLKIKIKTEKISSLRAKVNTYLRLIQTSQKAIRR